MPNAIDLNADMGESFGLYRYGADEELIRHVTSANLACGFHGGEPTVMRRSVALAHANGAAIGAHVGFPDLLGFGRRYLHVQSSDLKNYTTYQIGALQAFVHAAGATLRHVKPHGAMYMMCLEDRALADAVAEAVAEHDSRLLLYTIGGSAMADAAMKRGLRVVREFYADRAYHADGRVKMFGGNVAEIAPDLPSLGRRVVRLVREGIVRSAEGSDIKIDADSVCIHSDTPGAPAIAAAAAGAGECVGDGNVSLKRVPIE